MRQFYYVALLLGLLAARYTAIAQSTPAADTIPGQERIVRQLTASLCKQIEASGRSKSFDQLSPKEADALFIQLMMISMSEQAEAVTGLISAGQTRQMTPNEVGRRIGVATVSRISTDCPSSMALVIRTSSAQQAAGAHASSMNNITAEERVVLQPIADSTCARIRLADTGKPLRQLSPPARKQAIVAIMQTQMLKNSPALLKLYSAEKMSDQAAMEGVGVKVASLMMTQCPTFLILLGQDEINQKQTASKAAAAPPTLCSRQKRSAPNAQVRSEKVIYAAAFSLPASCPQAASISLPRERRMLVCTPRSARYLWKSVILSPSALR